MGRIIILFTFLADALSHIIASLWAESFVMRCYFHLFSDQEEILDEVGIEVTDLEQAKTEALKAISELRLEIGDEVEDWSTWRLEIVCPQGTLLHSMPLKNTLH